MGSEIGSERKKQCLDSSREKGSPGRETMEVLLAAKLTRSSEINWREGEKKKDWDFFFLPSFPTSSE